MLKKEISEKQEQNLDFEVVILSSLSKPDALKIFSSCEKGIENSTGAIKELSLTPKRYYTYLKMLIDAGIVEKRGNIYVQTAMGKFCNKLLKEFSRAISQRDQLQLTDKLMDSNTLSTEEKEKVLNVISNKDLKLVEIRMIANYDDCVDDVIRILNNTKDSAYLAASRPDLRAMNAVLNLVNQGVNLFYLSGERDYSDSMEILKAIFNPGSIKILKSVISSKHLNFKVNKDLSFSFLVSDGERGIIELPSQNIYVAFEFKSELISRRLIEVFNVLYEQGKEDPRISFIKKNLSFYK